ncbi:hypothetical protein F5Y06DRAFT_286638 [Hypoxylon sp. FL0890]|nr:hypothetical protein F5Y06DRAFT_286638 [Hypoxylon sp. FL0890]
MLSNSIAKSLALLAAVTAIHGHSWVEQVRLIDNTGAFTGPIGYPIGYMNRSAPDFNDSLAQNKILNTATNPVVCKPKENAYANVDRLSAGPGDYVALIYQENGHVTQPFLTPRPYRDGIVNVYGTLHHEDSDGINDVLNSWTADGKGGNGKGKLLATHYFDDGQCYQNAGRNFAIPIYKQRYLEHGLDQLYCQTDFQLPEDLPEQGTYTVMWVWDWPLITSDTQNTTEIYTSCAEIQLGAAKDGKNAKVKFSKSNPIQSAGISSQLATLIEATGLGIGTHSPSAPSSTATQDPETEPTSTATESSTESSSSSTKKHHGGVKTVTVTAEPQTTTKWKTVTVNDASSATQSETSSTATSTSAQQTSASTDTQQAAPTSIVPVTTISKFMKARATGQARREGDYRS